MSEQADKRQVFTLKEVTQSIQQTISRRYTSSYWVKAEMNKLNRYPHSGHCYPDLLQKENGQVVAQMRGTLWKGDYERVNASFIKTLNEPLSDGIQLLMLVSIHFDPNYGLTLRISDIDPTFTLGDLEKEKRETLLRLQHEGVLDLNKKLAFPLLPKRIAVISVSTSKGYADFLQITEARMKGFVMEHYLFPSLLQGEQAVSQITSRLKQIAEIRQHFDLVAIIRGGGGEVGLAVFNQYQLAHAIATFPLPVLTGIGHATNQTVAEMVAHTASSTPSELADLLMDRFESFSTTLSQTIRRLNNSSLVWQSQKQKVYEMQQRLPLLGQRLLSQHQRTFLQQLSRLKLGTRQQHKLEMNRLISIQSQAQVLTLHHLTNKKQQLSLQLDQLKRQVNASLNAQQAQVETAEKNIRLLDPQQLLKRGYSMSFHNGKLIKRADELQKGAKIVTRFHDGEATSTVNSIKKTHE